ncbi:MAG: PDZ domain-containing protein [candidate division Zixibacteria bacterium]|nr:PDZ domain-containing protein [candidate division Zixibacteria bacterium]
MKKVIIVLTLATLAVALIVGQAISKSWHSADRGWLGVTTESVDYDLAKDLELNVKYGAIIDNVLDDSPAEEAGIEEDDIIIALNGEKVTGSEDLIDLLIDTNEGDEVELTIIRDNKETKVTATLGEEPKARKFLKAKVVYDDDDDMAFLGHEPCGYIGVRLIDLTEQLGNYFEVKDGSGALIISVVKDSPAEKAELKAGDVIVELDSEEIIESEDVHKIVSDMEEGDQIAVKVIRDGKTTEFKFSVAEKDNYGYQFFKDSDIDIMSMRHSGGYHHHKNFDRDNLEFYFDIDAIEDFDEIEEIEDLDDLDELRKHVKRIEIDLSDDSKDAKKHVYKFRHNKDEFHDEVKELKEELKKMKKELRKELDEIHKQLD